jgi:flagellar hook-length control protein FliK
MDFAANAVPDLQPAPRAQSASRNDARSPEEQPFAEHLDAALHEETHAAPQSPSQRTPKKIPGDTVSAEEAAVLATPPVQQHPAQPWQLAMADGATPNNQVAAATTAETSPVPVAGVSTPATAPKTETKSAKAPKSASPFVQNSEPTAAPAQQSAATPVDATTIATTQPQAPALSIVPAAALQQNVAANAPAPFQAQGKPQESKIDPPALRASKNAQPKPDVEKAQAQPSPAAFRAALNSVQAASETIKQAMPAIDSVEGGNASQQSSAQIAATSAPQSVAALEEVASSHAQARAVPAAAQVAREIVRRFDGATTQFELRLDPPELGRVEVRLEVTRDHRVTAVVSADNPQALADLARHARDLEQMLQSAGLQLSDSGLAFDLRQGGERSRDAQGSDRSEGIADDGEGDTAVATPPQVARPIGYELWRGVRVDISV